MNATEYKLLGLFFFLLLVAGAILYLIKGKKSRSGSTVSSATASNRGGWKSRITNPFGRAFILVVGGIVLVLVLNWIFGIGITNSNLWVWLTGTRKGLVFSGLCLVGITLFIAKITKQKKGEKSEGIDIVSWAIMLVILAVTLSVFGTVAFGFFHLKTQVEAAERLQWEKEQAQRRANAPEKKSGKIMVESRDYWSKSVLIPTGGYIFQDEVPPKRIMIMRMRSLKNNHQITVLVDQDNCFDLHTHQLVQPNIFRGILAPADVCFRLADDGPSTIVNYRLIERYQ